MGPPLVAVGMGLSNDNCRQQGRHKNAGLHGRRSREPGKDCLVSREKAQATDRAEEGTGWIEMLDGMVSSVFSRECAW